MFDPHTLVINYLFPALCVFTLGVGYFVGLRPILKQTPAFKDLYDAEAGFLSAFNAKFGGLKQKITTLLLSVAGVLVVAHDSVTALLTQLGMDPASLGTQILPDVPAWVWPVGTIAVLWLVQKFRDAADKQARANAEALLNSGQPLAAPAPGLPKNTVPSPFPIAVPVADDTGGKQPLAGG